MIRKAIVILCLSIGLLIIVMGIASSKKELTCWHWHRPDDSPWGPYFRLAFSGDFICCEWGQTGPGEPATQNYRLNIILFRYTRVSSFFVDYSVKKPFPAHHIHDRFIRLSIWVPLILLAIYPTVAFIRGPLRRYRLYRRERKGLCLNCSYNLTGNVSGVCPECGKKIECRDIGDFGQ
ncbi:MAG: hypothetical protein ACYTF1_00350 [Planctomycetota bacterium]